MLVDDIYEYAEQFNADYFDMTTGYTYLVQEYNRAKEFGMPTGGIKILDSNGFFIGYAKKKGEE